MRFLVMSILGIICNLCLYGQALQSIGFWREHLPWGNAIQVELLGNELVCATPFAVFKYDKENREISRKSKINGLSDIGISAMSVDEKTGSVIIAYTSKIIDIWRNDKVITVPDLKITGVVGDFSINSIIVDGGFAYLSTNGGIILLDILKHEIKERWLPGLNENQWATNSICKLNDHWYASTKSGLKKIRIDKEGSDPSNWELVSNVIWDPNTSIRKVLSINNSLIVWVDNSIYKGQNGGFQKIVTSEFPISSLNRTQSGILVSTMEKPVIIKLINEDGVIIKSVSSSDLEQPQNILIFENEYWVADMKRGMIRINENDSEIIIPEGPSGFATGEIKFFDKYMWFASGAVNNEWVPQGNKTGIYRYSDQWHPYNNKIFGMMDSITDILTIAYSPQSGNYFAGSFGGGLMEISAKGELNIYKYNSTLGQFPEGSGKFNVSGLAVDESSNLWVSNFGSNRQLHLMKNNGQWFPFSIPFPVTQNAVGGIIIDNQNQKWIISPLANGLLVWNTGNNPEDPADDQWRQLKKGIGLGNLPSNKVLSVVKDRNGLIWVGTDNGMGIFNCSDYVFSNTCDAILPVLENVNQTGFLFQNQKINAIVIDGANRKWVGTSNGLWLISEDGEKVINHFTSDNSKLLSNEIFSLGLNPISGELFVATSNGICSYMSDATENINSIKNVLVFPNPVPPGYSGVIAIRGLPENSWVKITEINGRLVYQGKSLGGQMVWNGKDASGQSVSSGVYLVFSSDDFNKEKAVGKIFLTK